MEYAYLGLFKKVFEWVLSRIIDPVYRFVSNLLVTVFSWIFEEILAPVLLSVLEEALDFFIKLWLEIYSNHLYLLFSGVLKLIDYLETAFDVFIGLRDVTYTQPDGTVVSGSLVEVLMQQKTISTVFWVITLGALGLALILTIYATAKSAFDLDFENKRPVSKVLTAMMKTFIQFFTVPFFVYFMLKLSAVILRGVTTVMNFGNTTSLGRIVFMIASLNAAKNDSFNVGSDTALNIEFGTSSADTVRYPFYSMTGGNGISVKDYGNIKQVTEVFKLSSFDYLIGFIAAVFLLFTIGICLIVFVQRIFELMLLYLVSPYFVCMIPLDDGEKFGRWREMFIGKCFSGFGSAIGMRLFLMVCPMIMGNRIKFGASTSPEMDYIMKLFFLAGGAWAVYKSGSMITSLLSYQAGSSEANTTAVAGGMLFGHTVGYAMTKGQQAIRTGLGRGGAKAAGRAGGLAGHGLSGRSDGKFVGSRGSENGSVGLGRGPGIGKRINNTMAAGTEAVSNLRKLSSGLTGPNRSVRGTARQMMRTYDSFHNMKRASQGKEKASGIEMKFDRSIGAFKQGASALGRDFDTVEKSMRESKERVGTAFKAMVGPGSFTDKMGSAGSAAKSIYSTSKQFRRIGEDYGKMKVNIHEGLHHREKLGAFKMTLDSDNFVLAKEFPGTRFSQSPVEDPVKLRTNFESMGLFDDLESGSGSIGAGGSESSGSVGAGGSESSGGIGAGGYKSGESVGAGGSQNAGAGAGKYGSAGMGGAGGSGIRPGAPGGRAWVQGRVRPYQVRCTVPAVQKVTVTSAGRDVTYRSLSVRGVQFRGQTGSIQAGSGQRTRRNSI